MNTQVLLRTHPGEAPQDEFSAHIQPPHWQEWLKSGVNPELIARNVRSLSGETPYDYLCYSTQLERTNSGRLVTRLIRQYAHVEFGGWWCNGLDPLDDWQPMLWGCFKPNRPRIDLEKSKVIKYEHPPKLPTRAFFLNLTPRLWLEVATRYGVASTEMGDGEDAQVVASETYSGFWQWVLKHPTIPIILVEGAKRAACLLSNGYVAIALPGIFNGRRVLRDESGKVWAESLIPELALFAVPGRRFYFCFDHDRKPKTIKNVNLAILKTGKLLEQQGCEVQVIYLPGPEKGVDDFVVSRGAEAFQILYSQAASLSHWQWVQQQQQKLTYSPSLVLNAPDLSQLQFPALAPSDASPAHQLNAGILAICSSKGTGKTKLMAQLVADSRQVLLLTHRRCLGRSLAERMGLTWKSDADKANGQWIDAQGKGTTQRLGLCVDSLLSIDPNQFIGCDLVIDEVCQVLTHLLTSNTCRKDGKRPALLARLHWLMRVAHRVVVADADLNDSTLKYLQQLRGEDSGVNLIYNGYQPQGYPVQFLHCPNDSAITAQLLEDIQAGKTVLLQTDSKDYADAIAAMLPPEKRRIKITSDTSGNEEAVEFVRHINEQAPHYDVVIATPSMATGVSIEVDHFAVVYGVFFGTLPDADAAQALSRVRAPIPRIVWCAAQGKNFSEVDRSEYPWHIKRSLKTKFDQEAALIRSSLHPDLMPVLDAEVDWEQNPHLNLWADITANLNRAMWRLRDQLQARLLYEGNTVEAIAAEPMQPIKQRVQEAKQHNRALEYQAISTAPALSPTERLALEAKEVLSLEEKRALEKARLADFYTVPLEAVTPELVTFDERGKRRGQIARLEMFLYPVLATQKTTEAIAKQSVWKQGLWIPDLPTAEGERVARVLLGLLPFLVPGREWTNEDLEPLGAIARRYTQDVKRWLGFKIPDAPEQGNNLWIFRRLLLQLGIQIAAHRQGRNQKRSVWISPEAWQTVQSILDRRHLKRELSDLAASHVVTPSSY
ncbi:plasmid replication protein, CyRepA1 family [Trichocoleus desertorum]|uniref:DUF3854 domain-containing protein n=1 Tax=Trichocoleus desertorum GB2-A4 TaxID=2933944 RepID=A0ABV0JGY1_9CYAN|nr:DUF3854 domain-containing protein [Trichocoleus sp. FACHB-46]